MPVDPEQITTITDKNPDLEKKIAELEAKNKELADKNSEYDQFYKAAAPVIEFMTKDDTLRTTFNDRWAEKTGQKKEEKKVDSQEDEKIKSIRSEVDDVKLSLKEQAIKEFEDRFGISRLPEEDQKKIKGEIAQAIKDMGGDLRSMAPDKVGKALERAYSAVDPEASKKADTAGYVRGYTNGVGSMPSMQDGQPTFDEGGEKLTEAQRKWATKLGVDPKKAEEVMKNKDKEATTVQK